MLLLFFYKVWKLFEVLLLFDEVWWLFEGPAALLS